MTTKNPPKPKHEDRCKVCNSEFTETVERWINHSDDGVRKIARKCREELGMDISKSSLQRHKTWMRKKETLALSTYRPDTEKSIT